MAQPPWKDALARARRTAAAPAPPAPARPGAPGLPRETLLDAAPGLAPLIAEREALQQRMAALTGQSADDPRYRVEPLNQRRAALAAWADGRDALRDAARNSPRLAEPRTQADRHDSLPSRGLHDTQTTNLSMPPPLRPTAADAAPGLAAAASDRLPAPTLRPTPGELAAQDRPRRLLEAFERQMPHAATPELPLRPFDRPATRAEARRRPTGTAQARARATPPERPRSSTQDHMDQRLARARDLAAIARRRLAASDEALDAARDVIPSDWQRRRSAHIPGVGRDDPYVRETARKLSMAVGTLEELGQKADRLRSLARDMRELKAADEQQDEARRERALERLKARREEN